MSPKIVFCLPRNTVTVVVEGMLEVWIVINMDRILDIIGLGIISYQVDLESYLIIMY